MDIQFNFKISKTDTNIYKHNKQIKYKYYSYYINCNWNMCGKGLTKARFMKSSTAILPIVIEPISNQRMVVQNRVVTRNSRIEIFEGTNTK